MGEGSGTISLNMDLLVWWASLVAHVRSPDVGVDHHHAGVGKHEHEGGSKHRNEPKHSGERLGEGLWYISMGTALVLHEGHTTDGAAHVLTSTLGEGVPVEAGEVHGYDLRALMGAVGETNHAIWRGRPTDGDVGAAPIVGGRSPWAVNSCSRRLEEASKSASSESPVEGR